MSSSVLLLARRIFSLVFLLCLWKAWYTAVLALVLPHERSCSVHYDVINDAELAVENGLFVFYGRAEVVRSLSAPELAASSIVRWRRCTMCYSQSVVCRTKTLFDDELPDVSITPSVHPAASSLFLSDASSFLYAVFVPGCFLVVLLELALSPQRFMSVSSWRRVTPAAFLQI